MAQDLRTALRDRADLRFQAMEHCRFIIEWIKGTNPLEWVKEIEAKKGEKSIITEEEIRQKIRDWVNKSGDLIEKASEIPVLLTQDLIKVLKDHCGLEAKPGTSG